MSISAPHAPIGPSPLRRPGSIRRTTTIDTHWPDGYGMPMAMEGRARDLLSLADGTCAVVAAGGFSVLASVQREIMTIQVDPQLSAAQYLVGVRAGGASRRTLAAVLGEFEGTPLYQLLDDFPGASLVANWIWSQWPQDALTAFRRGPGPEMEGVCTGFATGSSALTSDAIGSRDNRNSARVASQVNPADLQGWHPFMAQAGPAMRRSRRLDLFADGDLLCADLGFQDSGSTPDGGRAAVHEYTVSATVDPHTMTLVSLRADPRVLPYPECPGAVANIARVVGQPVAALRQNVPGLLPGILGCTHLNDILRSLSDVPVLARFLR